MPGYVGFVAARTKQCICFFDYGTLPTVNPVPNGATRVPGSGTSIVPVDGGSSMTKDGNCYQFRVRFECDQEI